MKINYNPETEEIRGCKVRAYPTPEQEAILRAQQAEARREWNWLCARQRNMIDAVAAQAQREGLIPAAPPRPNYVGMEPEEAEAARKAHKVACGKRLREIPKERFDWVSTNKAAAENGLKNNYQLLKRAFSAHKLSTAHLRQMLCARFDKVIAGQKIKKPRKRDEDMPLAVGSGKLLTIYPESTSFYRGVLNWTKTGKIKLRIHEYAMQRLQRVLEGAKLVCEAGQWFAIFSTVIPKRDLTGPTDGSAVGIDPGLDTWAAMSDGTKISNHRALEHEDRISGMQKRAQELPDGSGRRAILMRKITREHARAKRRARQMCYELAKKLSKAYQWIGIEENHGCAVGVGHRHTANTYQLTQILRDRVGDRLREVPPHYNSQDCSQCGHRSKDSWSRMDSDGRTRVICTCPSCGHTENRDINAARNVRRKMLESLAA